MALRAPFTRSDDRWVGGVAAGLAHRLGVDPALTRSVLLLLTLVGGLGLILYGLGWILLPDGDGAILLRELFRGKPEAGLVGGVVMVTIGLIRPLFWMTPGYYDYGVSPAWSLYYIGVWSLIVAAVMTAIVIVLAIRARRERERLGLEMVSSPITRVLDEPDDTFAATHVTAPLADDRELSDEEESARPLQDSDIGGSYTLLSEGPTKSWSAESRFQEDVPDDARATTRAPKVPREPRVRRPKAGSRHLQATLAASLLSIALVALLNDGVLSFRSIAQGVGAFAIVWGGSTAIGAARGRRIPGTALIATLALVASVPALTVMAMVPAATMSEPINAGCGLWGTAESRVCAVASGLVEIDDTAAEQIRASGEPLALVSGIAAPTLWVTTDQPLIITAKTVSGRINSMAPGWTLRDPHGLQQTFDTVEATEDEWGNVYWNYPIHVFDPGNDVLTFASPGAVPGDAVEIHIETGIGDIFLDVMPPLDESGNPLETDDTEGAES